MYPYEYDIITTLIYIVKEEPTTEKLDQDDKRKILGAVQHMLGNIVRRHPNPTVVTKENNNV